MLVLCTSYALVEELAARLSGDCGRPCSGHPARKLSRCVPRRSARRAADAGGLDGGEPPGARRPRRHSPDPVPPACGARRGATRIPHAFGVEPGHGRGGSPRSTGAPRPVAGLAQGIGRGIRGPSERCTVWLLDPRFPLPKSLARAIGGPGQGRALGHLALINCIPARFRTGRRPALDEGRIWPLGPPGPLSSSEMAAPAPENGSPQ